MRLRFRWGRIALQLALLSAGLLACYFGYEWWEQRQEQSLLSRCTRAQRIGKWDELQQLAESWSRWKPRSADAWLFRADAAQHHGDFAEAARLLAAVPADDPKYLPALLGLSALQLGPMNRPLEGVQTCEQILKIDPLTAEAHERLIEFYAITLQRKKLIRQIRYAIEMDREPTIAFVYLFLVDSMRLANAVELNANWLKTDPGREVFRVAEVLQSPEPEIGEDQPEQDKHSRVKALFKVYPENVELLAYETDFAIRNGNIQDLAELLKRAPATVEDDDRFWRAKGWFHLNRNEDAKARQALEKALELAPLDWLARSWLADVELRAGNTAAADRQQTLVRRARRLREEITTQYQIDKLSKSTLTDLVAYSRDCGDQQVTRALDARLKRQK